MKKLTQLIPFIGIVILCWLSVDARLKLSKANKQLENQEEYITLCETFIQDYSHQISKIRDYILRDEYIDSLILNIDARAYLFASKTDILEYNLYALDRNQYWDKLLENE